jgi:ADP-ribose pyrophosphatase
VKPGEVTEYKWSLHGVDHTFLKGHRMMVEVQSSWFPLYDRNPQTYVENIMTAPAEAYKAETVSIYGSAKYPSHLDRYTVSARHLEFPQGGWEQAEVDPEQLARGELREETGLTAGRMTHLTTFQIAYGVMNQKHHCYLAEDLVMGEAEPDNEETDLVLHRVSVAKFEEMVLNGTIVDNCTVAAWGIYRLWRERRS